MEWQNRIVGYDNVEPNQLLANPYNFRIHSATQQRALTGSMETLGWVQDVIVNKRTGHIVDGHLRVSLALRTDQPIVPVKYVDLTEEEEAQALLSLDPISAMAGEDAAKIDELLQIVQTDNSDVLDFLSSMATQHGLDVDQEVEGEDEFAVFEEGDLTEDYVPFKFGEYGGKVSRAVYLKFVDVYKAIHTGKNVMIDDVLREWLDV